jgi:predicted metal-binding membrane protein
MTDMAVNTVLRRDRAIVIAAIITISVLAWAYILWLVGQMSMMEMPAPATSSGTGGMNMPSSASGSMIAAFEPAFRPWGVADFTLMFVMWAVMMVGMMTPSVAPMVLLYAAVGRKAAASGRPLASTGWFLAGYLSAWVALSLAATGVQWTLTRLALLTPMMENASATFGAFVLIAAGLYQWSPLKDTCLKQCQTPLGFLMSHGGFRSEAAGALRLGAKHGLYCIGCCWMLMGLLFVGGIMNVLWIAGLAILVLLEKVVPTGRLIPRLAGAGMAAIGLFFVVGMF